MAQLQQQPWKKKCKTYFKLLKVHAFCKCMKIVAPRGKFISDPTLVISQCLLETTNISQTLINDGTLLALRQCFCFSTVTCCIDWKGKRNKDNCQLLFPFFLFWDVSFDVTLFMFKFFVDWIFNIFIAEKLKLW